MCPFLFVKSTPYSSWKKWGIQIFAGCSLFRLMDLSGAWCLNCVPEGRCMIGFRPSPLPSFRLWIGASDCRSSYLLAAL